MNIPRQHLDILSPVFKNKLISAMLFLALTSCVPDAKQEQQDAHRIKMEKEIDSLEIINKRLDQQLASLQRQHKVNDSINTVEKNKKVSDMHFPIFKEPRVQSFEQTQIIEHNTLVPFDVFVKKLRDEIHTGKTLLLEESPEAILFKDSLSLFKFFDENNKNSLGQQVEATMVKNHFQEKDAPLTSKQEHELYNWFIKYLDGKSRGQKQERDSEIRNTYFKKEKIGNITLYYTDLDKRMPGIMAKHPSIQPKKCSYVFRDFRPFDTADLYSLSYDKPKQSVITVSSKIFAKYGINDSQDIGTILEKRSKIYETYC